MEDRRIQKSREAIRCCFLKLLKDKSLNKITVAEICRMANIGRGTFYLHYMDVYDLYESIENELYAGLSKIFEEAYPTTDKENSRRLSEELAAYIAENKELFQLLLNDETSHSLQRLKYAFNKKVTAESRKINPDESLEYDSAEAIFVVSGMIGVLEEWLIGGMRLPPSDIASMLDRMLCKINNVS